MLGGSAQQVVAIETAKRLGYRTILCDYLPDNPGQYVADKFYCVSTTDRPAILAIAQKEHVNGVIAYASDPAAPTAAYVAQQLGLPGNPVKAIETLCEKDKFRKFLLKNDFSTPKSHAYISVNSATQDIEKGKYTFPIIIKPVDSSGSKGVTIVKAGANYKTDIENAFSYSRCNRIVVEEFIIRKHKYLIGGDVFIVDGKVVLWGLMNCHRDQNVNMLVPVGKSFPLQLDQSDIIKVKNTIQRIIDILGFLNGPMNVELIIDTQGRVFPIDIGPRCGGNLIPELLSNIFEIDIVEMTIKVAMGESIQINVGEGIPYYASHNLHSNRSGRLASINFSNEIENRIVKKQIFRHIGEEVYYFDDASKVIGIVFFKFKSEEEMKKFLTNINYYINIKVFSEE